MSVVDAPPEGEHPWFIPVVPPDGGDGSADQRPHTGDRDPDPTHAGGDPESDDGHPNDDHTNDPGDGTDDNDGTDGTDGTDGPMAVAPGTILAWSPWAEDDQVPRRLRTAIASLAHRLTEDLPELSHQNPDGGQRFDHGRLVAALSNALGALSEVIDGRLLEGDDLVTLLGAAHDGAVISAIMAEATGEPSTAFQSDWLRRTAEEVHRAMWRRFAPLGDGRFRVRLRRGERALVGRVLTEQQRRLTDDGPELAPLFPAGYGDGDPESAEASAEFAALTRSDLMAGRSSALELVQGTLGERVIDAATLSAWMRTLNDVRLVMATELGIDHDDQPPPAPWDSSFPAWRSYAVLGNLVHEAVLSLRTQL